MNHIATNLKDDPNYYDFETEQEAQDYDTWLKAKVQEALDSNQPCIPHDEVVARMRARMAQRLKNVVS